MSEQASSGPSGHLGGGTRGESGKGHMGAGSKGGKGGSPATGLGGAHVGEGDVTEAEETHKEGTGQGPEQQGL